MQCISQFSVGSLCREEAGILPCQNAGEEKLVHLINFKVFSTAIM